MTETPNPPATAPPADDPTPPDSIARCACGVPRGLAHYCAAADHNWIKAPDPAERDDS